MDAKKQLELIKKGAVEIISEKELLERLERSSNESRPLKVKYGADPSSADIHLGHMVSLHKLRQLQELGHEVIFLIGDFTARIGDPSGQNETRPALREEEVKQNARTYKKQIFKILNEKKTKVVYNSTWCSKMNFSDVIKLASLYNVARMLERDDFLKRYRGGQPIGIHEFLYPLIQAYDSVILKADIELGGTDQKFNMLVARELQRDYSQLPQIVITMPLIVGTDNVQKMSKTLGNAIGINEPPDEIYGKMMCVSDETAKFYSQALYTEKEFRFDPREPFNSKKKLAEKILGEIYGLPQAKRSMREFEKVFEKRELPTEIPEFEVSGNELEEGRINIVKLLKISALAKSSSHAKRLIRQGGVTFDDAKIKDIELYIPVRDGSILKVGRRKFIKIKKKA